MTSTGGITADAVLVNKVNELLAKIASANLQLQGLVNLGLHKLPPPIQRVTIANWDKFVGELDTFWDTMLEIVENLGSPSTLSATANAWSDRIGGPVSGKAQLVTVGSLQTDTNWDGDAAQRYRDVIPDQHDALDAVQSVLANGISEALRDMRDALVEFWVEIGIAIAAYAIALAEAITASGTVIGIPAGVLLAIGAVAALCAGVCLALYRIKGNASNVNTKLRSVLATNGSFGNGHWPAATTDLAGTSGAPTTASQPAPTN